jgi:serine/threonine protein phosphatase 1
MATYCVSDLHGHFDELMTLLEVIEFDSEVDRLFILGDIIDRGPQSAELLWWLMKEAPQSVHCLLGNHEDMLWAASRTGLRLGIRMEDTWSYNGGFETLSQIRHFKNYYPQWEAEIFEWVNNLPLVYDLDIDGKRFILVHAGIRSGEYGSEWPDSWCSDGCTDTLSIDGVDRLQNAQFMLWDRNTWLSDRYTNWDFDIVTGHTPVQSIHNFVFDDLGIPWKQRWENQSILHFGKGLRKHLIDCGIARKGFLACLRLDDMREFYI